MEVPNGIFFASLSLTNLNGIGRYGSTQGVQSLKALYKPQHPVWKERSPRGERVSMTGKFLPLGKLQIYMYICTQQKEAILLIRCQAD